MSVFCFSNIIRRSCIDAQSTKTSVDQGDGDDDSLHDPDFVAENEVADSEDSGTIELEQDAALPLCDISNDQSSPEKSQRSRKRARNDGVKHDRNLDKYQLKPPCSCKMKCFEKILEDRRVAVHEQFWSMTYNNRRSFVHSHIKVQPKSRSRPRTGEGLRNFSRYYMLPNADGNDVFVCKLFFLRTLGYTSDKIITATLSATPSDVLSPPSDRRGKHAPANKKTVDQKKLVIDHILSHNPSISHYRREHAPNRLYLSPELTITDMHKDFKDKYPNVSVCYETYRKVVDEMNISFAKLGEEECELCLVFNSHEHDNEDVQLCSKCSSWREHNERARKARERYIADKEALADNDCPVLSTDMQKVLMLPVMPGVKSAVFTRRLVAFHQTFAPLGPRSKAKPVIGVIWHEAIAGRNAEDVASAFMKCFGREPYRDAKQFVIWCDNCSGQNKNWTLYTTLCFTVNRAGGPEQVTLRYLERGHTFMSADSFHASIEKSMKQKRNIYDFSDFSDCISKNGHVMQMQPTDFKDWPNGSSSAKFTHKPILKDVCEVQDTYI